MRARVLGLCRTGLIVAATVLPMFFSACASNSAPQNSVRIIRVEQQTGAYAEGQPVDPNNFVIDFGENVVGTPAPVPQGAVRYCWEEPIVEHEPNGPGVEPEGKWYHPSYIAVRQTRAGKWRPCRPYPSEIKGETRNER